MICLFRLSFEICVENDPPGVFYEWNNKCIIATLDFSIDFTQKTVKLKGNEILPVSSSISVKPLSKCYLITPISKLKPYQFTDHQ